MKILTREEAREAGYSGYAYHLTHIPCPQESDPKIYCVSCAMDKNLEESGHGLVIDIRRFNREGVKWLG